MNFGGTIRLNPLGVFVLLGLTFIFFVYMVARKPAANEKVNLKELLIAAVQVAEKGGDEIKLVNGAKFNIQSKGKTKEGANDPVTEADYKSHCVMFYGLRHTFPVLQIISEELPPEGTCDSYVDSVSLYTDDTGIRGIQDQFVPLEDVTIWIDPLDATQEFTEQLTQYVTTMVCVAVRGQPIIGVIHKPFSTQQKTSWAWVGKATSADLKPQPQKSNNPNIIISRSHAGNVTEVVKKAFSEAEVTVAGGAGYKVLQLISGYASAYTHVTKIKKWDVCAGDAILSAVGGKMSTLQDKPINYAYDADKAIKTGILAATTKHNWYYDKLKLEVQKLIET